MPKTDWKIYPPNIYRYLIIFGIIICVLLIPLIAMQFTDEVHWTLMDFIVMGLILSFFGILIDIVVKRVKNKNIKWIGAALLILLFLLIWAELAVGLFGSRFSGN